MENEQGRAAAVWVPVGIAGVAALMLAVAPSPGQVDQPEEAPQSEASEVPDRMRDVAESLSVGEHAATGLDDEDGSSSDRQALDGRSKGSDGDKEQDTGKDKDAAVPQSDRERIRSVVNGALKESLPAGSFRIARISYGLVPGSGGAGQHAEVSVVADSGKDDGKEAPSEVVDALAKMAEGLSGDEFDVRILALTVSGVPSDDYDDAPADVSVLDADWVVGASVDIPAEDGKSLGDVNSSFAVRHGKAMEFDLQAAGFSDKLPEE